MKGSHRFVVAALALAAFFFAAVALAKPVHHLDARVTPAKPGTRQKPNNVELRLAIANRTDNATEPTPATERLDVFLARQLRLRGRAFRSCSPQRLNDNNDRTKCPARTKVGNGQASFTIAGPFGQQSQNATVTAYNGPRGRSILFHLESGAPFALDMGLVGKLTRVKGRFGTKLGIKIPEELQSAALTDFSVALERLRRATRRRRRPIPYVGLGRCRNLMAFRSVARFRGFSEPRRSEDTVNCAD